MLRVKAIDLGKKKRKDGNVEGGNTNEKRDEESKRKGSAATLPFRPGNRCSIFAHWSSLNP